VGGLLGKPCGPRAPDLASLHRLAARRCIRDVTVTYRWRHSSSSSPK